MTQISPYLKPGSGGGTPPRRGFLQPAPGGDGQPARNSLNIPIAPVTGFWRRFSALVFDLLVLFFAFRGVGLVMGDALIDLGPAAHLTASSLVLLYFVLGNGPVGNGRTLGKMLVGIRVIRLDGAPMGIGQSALRAALLFPGLLFGLFLNRILFDPAQYDQVMIGILMSVLLTLALFIGNFFAIAFNPFKQGFHDHFARTLVVPASLPDASFSLLCDHVGEGWRKYYKQTQINGGISFTLIFALMAVMVVKSVKDRPEVIEAANLRHAIATDAFGPHTMLQEGYFPYPARRGAETQFSIEERVAFSDSLYDPDATDGLAILITVYKEGRFQGTRDELEQQAEDLARRYRDEFYGGLPPEALFAVRSDDRAATNLRQRPLRMDIQLVEQARLFFTPPMASRDLFNIELVFPPLEAPAPREVEETEESVDSASASGAETLPDAPVENVAP